MQVGCTTLSIYIQGSTLTSGAFGVKAGHTVVITAVGTATRPTYVDAAVYPNRPVGADQAFRAAGTHRWTLGVTITENMLSHTYWNIGVKIDSTLHVVKIRVS